MKLAIDEAREGIRHDHGGPFGVVIVKDGVVLSKEHTTVLRDQDSTCHAEIQAIREASKKIHSFDLSGCILFSTGKPCPMCSSAIKWAKISQVYYSLLDPLLSYTKNFVNLIRAYAVIEWIYEKASCMGAHFYHISGTKSRMRR